MNARCSICTHPQRIAIDAALMKPTSDSQVARDFQLVRASVRRHRISHLAEKLRTLEQAEARAAISHNTLTVIGLASDLYTRATRLADRAEAFYEKMEKQQQVSSRTVQAGAASLRELRAAIGLLADLVVDQPVPDGEDRANSELDAAIEAALFEQRMPELPAASSPLAGDAEVVEAELVQGPGAQL